MITDAAIKKALREAPTSGKRQIVLTDDGARGEGRLALAIRLGKTRISSEWFAVWYEDGKRHMAKIGAYPTMSLRAARQDFADRCRPSIVRGVRPEGLSANRARLGHPSDPHGAREGAIEPRPLRKAERNARAHALAISIARIERRDPTLGPYSVLVHDVRRAEAIIDDLERGDYQVVRVCPNGPGSG